jgi:hypothetical protein
MEKQMTASNAGKIDQRIVLAESFYNEGLSPEDWVERNQSNVYCWSLDEVEYKDEKLKSWILSVTKLLAANNPMNCIE